VDENLQRLIITNASVSEIQSYAIDNGMITMRSDGLMKVKNGISSVEELLRVTK
jgi:type IV pilus assembly protein PilB